MLNITNFINDFPKYNKFGEKITLVGATKMVHPEVINQAYTQGILHVGENKVQEFTQKLPFYPPATLHFIGHLQSNKVKYLVGKVHLIQSVDSLKLLNEINKQAQKLQIIQEILIEVNIGKDENKHGFYPEEVFSAVTYAQSLSNVKLSGLMTVLPKCENKNNLMQLCLQMRKLYDIINKDYAKISILSMGMSGDYLTAIECGSNMVRIGSALFGERNY